MITITPSSTITTLIIALSLSPEHQRGILDLNRSETEQKIQYLDGFVSATFHKSLDGTLVTEYAQWASREQFQAAYNNPLFYEHIPEVQKVAKDDWDFYEVAYVDPGLTQPQGTDVMTISLEQQPATIIIIFKVDPSQQQALLTTLIEDHERDLRTLPGFQAVSFHRGLSGKRIVAYLQFKSVEEFQAVYQHPSVQAHIAACNALATSEVHLYTVDGLVTAPNASKHINTHWRQHSLSRPTEPDPLENGSSESYTIPFTR
ncbi:MAG TPA: antibiotic biosynthesis monooxygenase [Ktedonobacteraceae bacterium]|nr:antibiotic biosynthesis monooxygenase [Ktedonobacteraceae bacterium]